MGGRSNVSRSSRAVTSASKAYNRQKLIESLDDLIKTPGKACYRTLMELASSCSKSEFVDLLHCPAFVGSGIREGSLGSALGGGKSQKTQVFNASEIAKLIDGASIEQSIFLLRKSVRGKSGELTRFSIGRTQENDILMMDFAISRAQAEVELRGEDYILKDLGSSNGTFVNGDLIDDRGVALRDGDRVRFARYEFQFLPAAWLYDLLKERAP